MTSKKNKQKKTRLKRSQVSKYAVRRKISHTIMSIFRYALLISLGFVIITPLLTTLKDAITSLYPINYII